MQAGTLARIALAALAAHIRGVVRRRFELPTRAGAAYHPTPPSPEVNTGAPGAPCAQAQPFRGNTHPAAPCDHGRMTPKPRCPVCKVGTISHRRIPIADPPSAGGGAFAGPSEFVDEWWCSNPRCPQRRFDNDPHAQS